MVQSSLMTWLSKPAAVTEPSPQGPPTNGNITSPTNDTQITAPPQQDNRSPTPKAPVEKSPSKPESKPKTTNNDLPQNVELRPCTKEDIPSLKRLTGLLLQIPYPDSFYREIIEDELTNSITLLAFWHDTTSTPATRGLLVGAIRCRLLAHPPGPKETDSNLKSTSSPMLYLSALVLLSPYRRHGIAAHMLSNLTRRAVEDYGVGSVGAHVWQANTEGLEWYAKRGFVEVGREEGYYRRLKPQGAVVLQRDVGVMDLVEGTR